MRSEMAVRRARVSATRTWALSSWRTCGQVFDGRGAGVSVWESFFIQADVSSPRARRSRCAAQDAGARGKIAQVEWGRRWEGGVP